MKTELIKKAAKFASNAHSGINHVRKYNNKPYIIHPAQVAKIVSSVTTDENMICAAWLHDTVEDTPVTIQDIRDNFGDDIASLVSDLTDISLPTDGNRHTRKSIDRKHTSTASPRAKTIKLADLIHNTDDIVANDTGFAITYIKEKELLLGVLQEGNPSLLDIATKQVNDAKISLQIR